MQELLASFEAGLAQLRIAVTAGAATSLRAGVQVAAVRLTRGSTSQTYCLVFGPAASVADASRVSQEGLPALLFTPFASPRTTVTLRQAGVQHLDTAGNAWIEFADLLIDIRGRPRPQPTLIHQHGATGNLFSAARAQVVCVLLADPQLWQASHRELARAAGVSLGQAHSALKLLAEVGFGPPAGPARQAVLLEVWAAAFPTGLGRRLTLASYAGDADRPLRRSADQPIYLSGAAAIGDLRHPVTCTLYVEELDPALIIMNRWRTDGHPNIVLRRKFWTTPDQEPQATPPVALWPLVYADLVNSEDPRVRSAARPWKESHAGSV